MRTDTPASRFSARTLGIALAAVLVAGLAAIAGPTLASAQTGGMHMSPAAASTARVGTTRGWYNGKTVKFLYSKNFFCRQPPHSKARSKCEVGANYEGTPAREFDPLYVIVPIGFTPARKTLQCPVAGHCIDHPHRIDLTRVFGKGTGHALLPPHSHVVTTDAMAQPEWWNVDVIGVTSQRAWHRIVTHKNYRTIQKMRRHHNKHVTSNITSNLFLYFSVLGG